MTLSRAARRQARAAAADDGRPVHRRFYPRRATHAAHALLPRLLRQLRCAPAAWYNYLRLREAEIEDHPSKTLLTDETVQRLRAL